MAAGAGKLVAQFSGWTGLEPTGGRAASIERRRQPMPELGVAPSGPLVATFLLLGRSRGAIGRVPVRTPCDPRGAPYPAGRSMDGPDARVDGSLSALLRWTDTPATGLGF